MAEYIGREALLWFLDARKRDTCNGTVSCLQMQRMVERLPAADVAPVVHGRWEVKCESHRCDHTGEYDEDYCTIADLREILVLEEGVQLT